MPSAVQYEKVHSLSHPGEKVGRVWMHFGNRAARFAMPGTPVPQGSGTDGILDPTYGPLWQRGRKWWVLVRRRHFCISKDSWLDRDGRRAGSSLCPRLNDISCPFLLPKGSQMQAPDLFRCHCPLARDPGCSITAFNANCAQT